MNISPYGAPAAGEGEEWQRDRNGHIDANLTYVDLMLYVCIEVIRTPNNEYARIIYLCMHVWKYVWKYVKYVCIYVFMCVWVYVNLEFYCHSLQEFIMSVFEWPGPSLYHRRNVTSRPVSGTWSIEQSWIRGRLSVCIIIALRLFLLLGCMWISAHGMDSSLLPTNQQQSSDHRLNWHRCAWVSFSGRLLCMTTHKCETVHTCMHT